MSEAMVLLCGGQTPDELIGFLQKHIGINPIAPAQLGAVWPASERMRYFETKLEEPVAQRASLGC